MLLESLSLVLIVFLLTLAIYILFNKAYGGTLVSSTNQAAINLWVKERSASFGTDKIVADYPPVPELEDPLEIKSRDDLLWKGGKPPKAYKEIGDSMIDCWKSFDRGKTDFINTVERTPFCFKCRAISFSNEIKKEKVQMLGFNRYLNEQKVGSKSTPTYMQYFANDNFYNLSEEEIGEDKTIIERDLYVYLFAASGRGIANIMSNLLGAGDIVPEEVSKAKTSTLATTTTISERAEISAATSGVLAATKAGTYTLNTLQKAMQQKAAESAAETAARGAVSAEAATITEAKLITVGEYTAGRTAAQAGEKVVVSVATKTVEEKVAKTVANKVASSALRRLLAGAGSKVIGGPIGWYLIVGTAAYGTYNIVFGEKPFSANVMLVDPVEANALCNAKAKE